MRLIDSDRLLAYLKEENVVPICIQNLTKKNKQIIKFENMIYEQPTAYDIDGVVEQLNTDSSIELYGSGNSNNYLIPVERAINIVKEGGIINE
jgi:hypothetical protein